MKKPNPMAKDLRQSKYKQQVIPDKKKPVPKRKEKHKDESQRRIAQRNRNIKT